MRSSEMAISLQQCLLRLVPLLSLLLSTASQPCGGPLFDPVKDIVRNAYLLTDGESLILSCSVCGVCVKPTHLGCSDRFHQLWMTQSDIEKAQIHDSTKIKRTNSQSTSGKGFLKRMRAKFNALKEKMARAQNRIKKVYLLQQQRLAIAMHRFERLKQLGFESESGVGIFKVLMTSGDDSALQWYLETSSGGEMSRVKHEVSGVKLLFDLLVISRASAGNTGTYTCRWNGRLRAQFAVTVVDAGVEPYREFEPSSGRSLQPKRMAKANLEIYTRWMGQTRSFLLPTREQPLSPHVAGTVGAVNVSVTWGICYVKQLDLDRPVVPEGCPLLKLMPDGLPCRSHLLPISVRSLRSVIMRPSEARKMRTVIRVNSSSLRFGLKSANYTQQSPPPLTVDATVIKRSFMIAKQGEFVTLECPLKQTIRTLVVWFKLRNTSQEADVIETDDIIDGVMNPFDLRETTLGRVFMDPGGNLNIASVDKEKDNHKHFCLHKDRLVGYVSLIVRHAQQESYIMYVMSFMMNVLQVASPLVITVSIIFLTLITASSMFEPEVPW